jgi:hypothetical protein
VAFDAAALSSVRPTRGVIARGDDAISRHGKNVATPRAASATRENSTTNEDAAARQRDRAAARSSGDGERRERRAWFTLARGRVLEARRDKARSPRRLKKPGSREVCTRC